jgi:hypothetical protein
LRGDSATLLDLYSHLPRRVTCTSFVVRGPRGTGHVLFSSSGIVTRNTMQCRVVACRRWSIRMSWAVLAVPYKVWTIVLVRCVIPGGQMQYQNFCPSTVGDSSIHLLNMHQISASMFGKGKDHRLKPVCWKQCPTAMVPARDAVVQDGALGTLDTAVSPGL